jgi:8-oxo-dGTP pyrophosphatase MutT (NUDIX family)
MQEPPEPRQAASVIVVRGGSEALEVLLLRRNPAARFMGGAWVFPGGALDAGEDHRSAAVREAEEEAGLVLPDTTALIPFSRWIPTIKHLEQLAEFGAADELVAWATGREIVAVEPRIVQLTGEAARVVMPDER